jgi:hypothetical protein
MQSQAFLSADPTRFVHHRETAGLTAEDAEHAERKELPLLRPGIFFRVVGVFRGSDSGL